MFLDPEPDISKKHVKDKRNGMISMHDFKLNEPLEAQLPGFYSKMLRRAQNTNLHLSACKSAGMIMNRQIQQNELIDFSEALHAMYPHCSFHILNIYDKPNVKTPNVDFQLNHRQNTITQISYNDAHINGRNAAFNPNFWLGNENLWSHIPLQIFHVKGARMTRIRLYMQRTIAIAISLCKKIISV